MGEKIIAKNKKAFFNYEIINTWEAGIVLNGPEIKSIRAQEVSINEAFILIRHGEIFILNMHIKKYPYANHIQGLDETRTRKLLLNQKEIKKISTQVKENKLAIVPLKLYFKSNYVKLEIGLGRGKKLYDKREVIKKRDEERRAKKSKY